MKGNSTLTQLISKIEYDLRRPSVILIFGADSEHKKKVADELRKHTPDLASTFRGFSSASLIEGILKHDRQNLIIIVSGADSAKKQVYEGWASKLRLYGASSVIGVYAQENERHATSKQIATLNRQITTLKKSPPSAECFDYLVTIAKE